MIYLKSYLFTRVVVWLLNPSINVNKYCIDFTTITIHLYGRVSYGLSICSLCVLVFNYICRSHLARPRHPIRFICKVHFDAALDCPSNPALNCCLIFIIAVYLYIYVPLYIESYSIYDYKVPLVNSLPEITFTK